MGMLLTEEGAVYRLQAHGYDEWLAYQRTCEMRLIPAVAPSRHFTGDRGMGRHWWKYQAATQSCAWHGEEARDVG